MIFMIYEPIGLSFIIIFEYGSACENTLGILRHSTVKRCISARLYRNRTGSVSFPPSYCKGCNDKIDKSSDHYCHRHCKNEHYYFSDVVRMTGFDAVLIGFRRNGNGNCDKYDCNPDNKKR